MGSVNIALELFAAAVTVVILLCCVMDSGPKTKQTRLFAAMLVLNALVLACDALTWALAGQEAYTPLLYALNFLVYTLGYGMTALFTAYMAGCVTPEREGLRRYVRAVCVICALAAALAALSLVNHMYFRFEDGVYVRGPLFWVSQAFPIGVLLTDMLLEVICRRELGVRDTLALLSYGLLPVLAMAVQIAVYGVTLLYPATTLSLLIIYVILHTEQSARLQEQENALMQASVSIMLSQIQPHFLYNSLAVIKGLCEEDPQLAKQATVEFSLFLRGNLDSLSSKEPIPFRQELDHVRHYLSIEKLRFNDRLRVEYDVRTEDFSLPPLSIQPIVENAVRYGVTKRPQGGTVRISAWEEPERFVVEIRDDGVGFDPYATKDDGRTHIGIDNVKNRLAAQCGGTLEIASVPDAGTTAVIAVPKG